VEKLRRFGFDGIGLIYLTQGSGLCQLFVGMLLAISCRIDGLHAEVMSNYQSGQHFQKLFDCVMPTLSLLFLGWTRPECSFAN